jgi:aminopeptidase N
MSWENLFECRRAQARDSFVLPGTEPQYAPDQSFDTEHILLDLTLDIAKKTLSGTCALSLVSVNDDASVLELDAVSFKLESVKSAGKAVRHKYDGKKIRVELDKPLRVGERLDLTVAYGVTKPKLGLYFVGPDRSYKDKPVQVWTQGEDEYARYWFPCQDAPQDRVTTELIVRVPEGFTAVSNGRLERHEKDGKTELFHWKQEIPHATYLVTLAVGKFAEIKDKWRDVPVLYYCQPGREDDARRAFGKTPAMMEFFSEKIGVPYAYPKYAQVAAVDFIYGGMENTSATTQTALTLHDERAHLDFSSDPLVAHELAHQWFGDLLTCRTWAHAWLNESFATYFEALFQEHDKGRDEFIHELAQNAESYLDEDKGHYRRPIVSNNYKQPSDLFDRHLYEKGSLVLHMLRVQLGDRDFWKAVHAYVEDNKGRTVETSDLVSAVRRATGRNMDRFFDQWVYKAGHPEYQARYWWDPAKKEAVLRVKQTHGITPETPLFCVPVVFAFRGKWGEKRFTKTVDGKSQIYRFKLPSEPELILFDPDHTVLKRLEFPLPDAMKVRRLTDDPHPMGRVEAAQSLGQTGGADAEKALSQALFREKTWYVQGEIAKALAQLRTPEALKALRRALKELKHPKARRLLLAALGNVRDEELLSHVRSTFREEESYYAEGAALRSLAQGGDPSAWKLIEETLETPSWNEVLAGAALEASAAFRTERALALLKRYSAYGHFFPLRLTAVRGLAQVGKGREDVRKHLLSLTKDPFVLVQLAAVRALRDVGDERAANPIQRLASGDLDGRLKRTAEEVAAKLKESDGDGK